MTQEIESVKPTISVIIDDGECIISSTGPVGKAMTQVLLPLVASSRRVVIIGDGEMKVLKRNGNGANAAIQSSGLAANVPQIQGQDVAVRQQALAQREAELRAASAGPDIQDQFVADVEAGVTGEIATGEVPKPPAPRRKPQIFQDAAAPPSPELVEAEMDRLLQEAAQADRDAAKVAEDQRFQRQQAVQAGDDTAPPDNEAPARPRKREPRNLDISGRACGNCGGGGQSIRIDSTGSPIMDAHGQPMSGVCQVCSGSGQVKAWGRGRGR